MNAVNESRLREQFPTIYGNVYIGVGDGWVDLLYELSTAITDLCNERGIEIPQAVQIKEKFGGLRFYVTGSGSDEIDNLIYTAEAKSRTICEQCGDVGSQTKIGWVRTLCSVCRMK